MIKHSKFKNSGLIFELLVRQVTADALADKPSKAVQILKNYFSKGELSKEYKLYESIINTNSSSEHKAESVINLVLETHKKLNNTLLKKKKYNLIKDIKESYDIDKFFQYRVPNYKTLASIYTLFEANETNEFVEPQQIINNKNVLLEYITKKHVSDKSEMLEEYNKLEPDIQILAYRKLLEKFNNKYNNLSKEQKSILKEYIINDASTDEFKNFINSNLIKIKSTLTVYSNKITDPTLKIKINEILSNIKSLDKVKDEDVTKILHYYELIKELKNI